jgi:hypothetical protein
MRVRVLFLTSGIRVVLSCNLNISCSSPSHASLDPQPATGTLAVPAHPSSPAQLSSSSSEASSSPRSSPPLARHVHRTISPLVAHRQEVEVVAAEECERATAETAVTATRATRLAMVELAAAREEVEAAAAVDAARAATAELEALCSNRTSSSVSVDGGTDNELKLAREAAREQAAQWAVQIGADALAAGSTEIMAFTDGAALPPQTGTMVTMGSMPLLGTSIPAVGGLPSPRPTTSSGPW